MNVVIVGGGVSGVAVAIHLLPRGGPDLHVVIVERGAEVGRGVAFGVRDPVFRLNVPASKMSLDPRIPGDFATWAGVDDQPDVFLPRAKYGDYVSTRFSAALRNAPGQVTIRRGDVVAIDDRSVSLSDGARLPADTVVLATGIAPRVAPSSLPHDPRIIDAWDERGLSTLPTHGRVLVLGAGLSALDVVALLDARGFDGALTILSRRGLLPRPHLDRARPPVPLALSEVDAAPSDLRGLVRWVRLTIHAYEQAGHPWQLAIDALRPHVSRLYRALSARDRARFVLTVRPYWDVLRHRAPIDALALIDRLRGEGRLEVLAGRIAHCEPHEHELEVEMVLGSGSRRRERVDFIVRCIGPALEPSEADTPLVRALIASGLAAADQAGLGIETDPLGRVVDASGKPSERLFAIGAVRRASSWETTAIPDISIHALALAERILP